MVELTYDSFIERYSNFIKSPIKSNNSNGFVLKNGVRIFFKDSMISDSSRVKLAKVIKEWRENDSKGGNV